MLFQFGGFRLNIGMTFGLVICSFDLQESAKDETTKAGHSIIDTKMVYLSDTPKPNRDVQSLEIGDEHSDYG